MEVKEGESFIVPSDSMLIVSDENNRVNNFESEVLFKEILPKNTKEDLDNNNKMIKELEDILICCICYNYLENPVNDPTCCPHYACKKCIEKYFQQKRSNIIPCPLCRKYIKKKNLIQIPIIDSIKEIIKEAQNNKINEELNINIQEKCEAHSQNKIFSICLDCKKKMCPICDEEKKKHEDHHIVNYERYIKLFYFFRENFTSLQETIADKEQMIKESNKLYAILEDQKQAYISFLDNFSKDIKKLYFEKQENLNKNIAKSMQLIAKLKNFMKNIKEHVSKQFKNGYNDIDNLEEIEEEVKKRIERLKLKELKNEEFNIKDYNSKHLVGLLKKPYTLSINKQILLDKTHILYKLDKEGNYCFGLEISDKDKNMMTLYLDINKVINEHPNYSSYIAVIEFFNKKYYLLPFEVNKKFYSLEKTIPIKELFDGKVINSSLNLTIYSFSLTN